MTIDSWTLRKLSVKHGVDPRSIKKELDEPGAVRGIAGERARAAAEEAREISAPPAQERSIAMSDKR